MKKTPSHRHSELQPLLDKGWRMTVRLKPTVTPVTRRHKTFTHW